MFYRGDAESRKGLDRLDGISAVSIVVKAFFAKEWRSFGSRTDSWFSPRFRVSAVKLGLSWTGVDLQTIVTPLTPVSSRVRYRTYVSGVL
jgi:hypothetical protein